MARADIPRTPGHWLINVPRTRPSRSEDGEFGRGTRQTGPDVKTDGITLDMRLRKKKQIRSD